MFHTIMINGPHQGWPNLQGELGSCLGQQNFGEESGSRSYYFIHTRRWGWGGGKCMFWVQQQKRFSWPCTHLTWTHYPMVWCGHGAVYFCMGNDEFRSLLLHMGTISKCYTYIMSQKRIYINIFTHCTWMLYLRYYTTYYQVYGYRD